MKSIKAILFDFGGTLDCPRHWLDRFVTHYRAADVAITREALAPAFDHATRTAYAATDRLHQCGLDELLRFLVSAQFDYLRGGRSRGEAGAAAETAGLGIIHPESDNGLKQGTPDEIIARISLTFGDEMRVGMAHSRQVLGSLAQSFRLGVVSNFYGNLDRVLAEAGLDETLEVVVDSSRVGWFKPDERIFTAALRRLALAPGETAMIGDSWSKDCVPARQLGLTTVWLRTGPPAGQMTPQSPTSFADHVIGTIDEVCNVAW